MEKLSRFLIVAVVILLAANVASAEGFRTLAKQGGQGFDLLSAQEEVAPYSVALTPIFGAAAAKYNVPVELLETLAYFGSAFENRGSVPNLDGGYGITALRDNILTGDSLNEAAALTGIAKSTVILDPAANVNGCAAVLDSYAKDIDRSAGLDAWLKPVIKYAGFNDECSHYFAYEVFSKLQSGLDFVNSQGEQFKFAAQNIGNIDLESLKIKSLKTTKSGQITVMADITAQTADYGPAQWVAACSSNYSTATHSSDTVVIHTIEGSAASAISWFQNCDHGAQGPSSSHYVIAENGTVTQMVLEAQTAWHAGCYNSRSIGLEHEGYASQSSHPASLYNASAALTREICNERGIPKAHRSCGPGICGHIDVNNCACGPGHTDPGNGWNWDYYINQVNGGSTVSSWPTAWGPIAKTSDGRLEVFVLGGNGQIYHRYQTSPNGGWYSSWPSLSGNVPGTVSCGIAKDGKVEIFVRGSDGYCWHKWMTSSPNSTIWSTWESLGYGGAPVTGDAGVGRSQDGRIEFFYVCTDGQVWHRYQTAPNSGWGAWLNQGNPGVTLAGNVGVAAAADGQLEIFVRGTDGNVWHKWQTVPNGAFGNWENLGHGSAAAAGSPKAGISKDGRIEFFVRGTDNHVWHKYQTSANGGWSSWLDQGTPSGVTLVSDISVISAQDGQLEIFVAGSDGNVWHKWQSVPNGAFGNWENLGGGGVTGDVHTGSAADGKIEIFYRHSDGSIRHRWQSAPNSGWVANWENLGANVTAL